MKRTTTIVIMSLLCVLSVCAQEANGTCGEGVNWYFDGQTLFISKAPRYEGDAIMENYDLKKKIAPWTKKNLQIRKVDITGLNSIGSCAFANNKSMQEVVFRDNSLQYIGWGAFYNCARLRSISLPMELNEIGKIAFAKCQSLTTMDIPGKCRVGDQAFASCLSLLTISIDQRVRLGRLVFASEIKQSDKVVGHAMYNGEIRNLPQYINEQICEEYGLSKEAVNKFIQKRQDSNGNQLNYDAVTSDVDETVPLVGEQRIDTYVLIIGNQNYRAAANVPYAIHDARVFGEYCKKTLGVPSGNIHIAEDATKQMILEEELDDWVASIPNKKDKKFIFYYAGHGVPDTKNGNKSYLLPTDVRGTAPQRGIALDNLYAILGRQNFSQTVVFMDACFSGTTREGEGVVKGTRGTALSVKAEEPLGESMVVFSATNNNETAQAYDEQGHGLFTYCLLKELQSRGADVTLGQLSENLKKRMRTTIDESKSNTRVRRLGSQTVNTTMSKAIGDVWQTMSF